MKGDRFAGFTVQSDLVRAGKTSRSLYDVQFFFGEQTFFNSKLKPVKNVIHCEIQMQGSDVVFSGWAAQSLSEENFSIQQGLSIAFRNAQRKLNYSCFHNQVGDAFRVWIKEVRFDVR